MEKKKTRFFLIIGILIVVTISSWLFMARGLKETYRILDNDTPEVKSQINIIKDYRKLKGYKIIKDTNEYKMVMISAGLTYGKDDKIEITNVNFDSNGVVITVQESIDPNPEKEVINYPFVIVKLDTNKDHIKVVNTNGDEYSAIDLDNSTNSTSSDSNNNTDEDNSNKDEETVVTDDENNTSNEESDADENQASKDEEKDTQENTTSTKQISVEYQGRIDDESIEVKIGNDYTTLYLSEGVKSKINNYDSGAKLTLGYIEENGQRRVVSVK